MREQHALHRVPHVPTGARCRVPEHARLFGGASSSMQFLWGFFPILNDNSVQFLHDYAAFGTAAVRGTRPTSAAASRGVS